MNSYFKNAIIVFGVLFGAVVLYGVMSGIAASHPEDMPVRKSHTSYSNVLLEEILRELRQINGKIN